MVLTPEQGRTKAFSCNLDAIHMPRTTKSVLTKEPTSMHLNALFVFVLVEVLLVWLGGGDGIVSGFVFLLLL